MDATGRGGSVLHNITLMESELRALVRRATRLDRRPDGVPQDLKDQIARVRAELLALRHGGSLT